MATKSENVSTELHTSTKHLVSLIETAALKSFNFVSAEDVTEYYKKVFVHYSPKEGCTRALSGSSVEANKLRTRMKNIVMEDVKDSLNAFLVDSDIDNKLRELERLKAASIFVKDKKAWRPPGDAIQHMKPFNVAAKLEEKAQLQLAVQKIKERMEALKARLAEKRKRAVELHSSIQQKQEALLEGIKIQE